MQINVSPERRKYIKKQILWSFLSIAVLDVASFVYIYKSMIWFPIKTSYLMLLACFLIAHHGVVLYHLYRKLTETDPNAMPDKEM